MKLACPKQRMRSLNLLELLDTPEGKDEFYDPVFGPVFGSEVPYGTLFTYLFRRFGYPNFGWDDLKDIGRWVLTTPDKNVVLSIRPHPSSGVWAQFSILAAEEITDAIYGLNRHRQRPTRWEDLPEPFLGACAAATKAAKELRRPVRVRDQSINPWGLIDERTYRGMYSTTWAKSAGYPSGALGNIDPKLMGDIHHAVYVLGKGNLKRGMQRLLEKSGVQREP
jgi:hypothetical protein